jgi:hypothetical protein
MNEKVMRAIKKPDSAMTEGQRIYYNHIRPHQALNGKTPAEAAGIDQAVEGNRWESMIKKAVEVRQGLTEAKAEAL